MEPWLIGFLVQAAIQLVGLAVLGGIMWNKLAQASTISEDNRDLLVAIRVAMATAKAQGDDITLHVGDLEIRVRKLEQKWKQE